MPAFKETSIHSSFFPEAGDNERVERVSIVGAPQSKGVKRFLPKRQKSHGPVLRDLREEGEGAEGESGPTPPSTQPSTRRSSLTAVGDAAPGSDDTHEKGDEKGGANEKSAQGPPKSNNPADFGNDKIVLVQFEDGDPENPLNWSKSKKWVITILLDAMTVAIGLSTTAYSSGISRMTEEFGVANVVGQLGLTTFNCACAIAPLFLAPFCELVGRREVFLSAYFGFTVIFILIADAPNIGAVLAGRLLSGIFGSCGTILVGGTLADISESPLDPDLSWTPDWNTRDRGIPMSTFTFSAIFGTIAAPVYSGFIDQSIGWRWLQWIHMIANGALLVLEIIFLRETRGAKILARRAKALRKETGKNNIRAPVELENESVKDLLRTACTRSISLLVREPVVLAFGLWIAFAWGLVFLFLSAIPLCFQNNHGWSEGVAGLPYIALILGCFIGFGTSRWSDIVYDRKRDSNNGIPVPEYRLIGAMAFAWLMPAGLFIFSFTQYGFITPVAPIISLVCILVGIYHVFNTVYNYTSDAYPEYASSAIAGQGLLRNMFGGVTPLFANQMFNGMGYQYAGLLLSLLALLAAPLPFVLFKYGERIRAKSKYASSDDELEKERITDDNVNERGVPSTEAQYTSSFAV